MIRFLKATSVLFTLAISISSCAYFKVFLPPHCEALDFSALHEYCLTPSNLDWAEAANYAGSLGGYLVTINSQSEQDFLLDRFGNDTWYWIGFTDIGQEGEWFWANGEPVTYTNWVQGEPNEQSDCDEDFAIMNWGTGGKWKDLGVCSPEWNQISQGIVEIE